MRQSEGRDGRKTNLVLNTLSPEDQRELVELLKDVTDGKAAARISRSLIARSGSFESWRDVLGIEGVSGKVTKPLQRLGVTLGESVVQRDEREHREGVSKLKAAMREGEDALRETIQELGARNLASDVPPISHPKPGLIAVFCRGNPDEIGPEAAAIVESSETIPFGSGYASFAEGMSRALKGALDGIRGRMEHAGIWDTVGKPKELDLTRDYMIDQGVDEDSQLLPGEHTKFYNDDRKAKVSFNVALRMEADFGLVWTAERELKELIDEGRLSVLPVEGERRDYLAQESRALVFTHEEEVVVLKPFVDYLALHVGEHSPAVLAAYLGGVLHGRYVVNSGFSKEAYRGEDVAIINRLKSQGILDERDVDKFFKQLGSESDRWFNFTDLISQNDRVLMVSARLATELVAEHLVDLMNVPREVRDGLYNGFIESLRPERERKPRPTPNVGLEVIEVAEVQRPSAVPVKPPAEPAQQIRVEPVPVDEKRVYGIVDTVWEKQDYPDLSGKDRYMVAELALEELSSSGIPYRPGMVTSRLKQLMREQHPEAESTGELESGQGLPLQITIDDVIQNNPYVELGVSPGITTRALQDLRGRTHGELGKLGGLIRHVSSRHHGGEDPARRAMFDRLQERRSKRVEEMEGRLLAQERACDMLLDREIRAKIDAAIAESSK